MVDDYLWKDMLTKSLVKSNNDTSAFKRAVVEPTRMPPNIKDHTASMSNGQPYPLFQCCQACNSVHPQGSCPLKLAGVELCNLCGRAHYGHSGVCPHLKSETMVTEMISAVKQRNEPTHLKDAALK